MSTKIEDTQVFGWEAAIRGGRNPMNSWKKSDSEFYNEEAQEFPHGRLTDLIKIGPNDHKLLMNLCKGGTEESKWRRMVHVQMDVTAPLYWWKEFDTYKVGTVANSCSTMHKIAAKEFELDDFSHDQLSGSGIGMLEIIINSLNANREKYLDTKNKDYWWQLIQLLPTSYNQKRTITMNYENVITIIKQRTGHKLDEWNTLIEILKDLPYIKEITE